MCAFQVGDGRLGDLRCAADIPAGIAGNLGKITAFAPDADIPALSCKGASDDLGGQLDFFRKLSTLRKQGVDIPLEFYSSGHNVVSAAPLGKATSKSVNRPTFSASYFEWAFSEKRLNLPNGELRLPYV